MRPTGKRYTDDFKKMLLEVYNSGKPVLEICSEYGVTNATIYNWLKNPPSNEPKKAIIKVVSNENNITNAKQILKLEKQLSIIKEENEILKKAIAMFAKKETQD